jgi:hypothetical protein
MAARANPLVFVHSYSDKGASWAAWREVLHRRLELDPADIRTCTYGVAEQRGHDQGFSRGLRFSADWVAFSVRFPPIPATTSQDGPVIRDGLLETKQ